MLYMKRHQIIKITSALGLLVIGWLLIEYFRPPQPEAVTREKTTDAAVQSSRAETVLLVRKVDLNPLNPKGPSFPAPVAPWHEKLSALHKMGKVFGESGEEQLQELQTFVDSLSPSDLPDVVRELQELQKQDPTESGRELQWRLLRHWAESDARAAATVTAEMPEGSDRQEALANIVGVWARQNFSEAATWAGQLSNGDERQSALESVASEAVYTDPQGALKLAVTLPSDSSRDELITRATEVWAASAPEDTVAWAKQIPDEALREQVISGIATTWGSSDPVAAANLAINSLPAGEFQDKAVLAIVQRWALTDQGAAEAWVAKFPEGPLRQSAQETIAREIKRSQPPLMVEQVP
jgi:hypothetical protein